MKRILLTIVAIAAITLSAAAQGLQDIQSTSWYGGPGKSYVDRATLDSRAENYHFIINESNSDIHLCIRKDGRKAWYSFNGGVHFMGYYEESITNSEKKIRTQAGTTATTTLTTSQGRKGRTANRNILTTFYLLL